MEQGNSNGNPNEVEARLDALFRAYRAACDYEGATETSANFMPVIWSRIEAREVSTNWFGRVAKALVTAALAASVILGMMISLRNQSSTLRNQPSAFFDATFVDALRAEQASTLEPLHLERISELEPQ